MYGFCKSIIGTKPNKKVCQDYSASIALNDGTQIAVIADGLGSKKYSQDGSNIAVNRVIYHFSNVYLNLKEEINEKQTIELLKYAYSKTLEDIKFFSKEKNKDFIEYATTLTTVIWNKNWAIYGHNGDGAIFQIDKQGYMEKVTVEQSGNTIGEVFPFYCGENFWSFGKCDNEAKAFILVTDGVLEYLTAVNKAEKTEFYIKLIEELEKYDYDNIMCEKCIEKFLRDKNINRITNDDKTFSILINDSIKTPKEIKYIENSIVQYPNIDSQYFISDIETLVGERDKYTIFYPSKNYKIGMYKYKDKIVIYVYYKISSLIKNGLLDVDYGLDKSLQFSEYIINKILYLVDELKEFKGYECLWEDRDKELKLGIGKTFSINFIEPYEINVWQNKEFFEINIIIPNEDIDMARRILLGHHYELGFNLKKALILRSKMEEEINSLLNCNNKEEGKLNEKI